MANNYNNKIKRNTAIVMNKKRRNNKIIFITLAIVAISCIVSTVCFAQLSNLDKKVMAQENEIKELKKTKESLEGEIKGIKSSLEIQDEAMYKLGMVHPQDDQIVYVDGSKNELKKDVNNNVFLSPIISVLKSFTNN